MPQEAKIPVFTERFRLTLLERRVLVLDGVLDDDNGTLLATQFLTLADEDEDEHADIALWINSPGGSVPSMLAIRDIMRLIPCDVATLAFPPRPRSTTASSTRSSPTAPDIRRRQPATSPASGEDQTPDPERGVVYPPLVRDRPRC
jgi:Clp protease